MEPLDLWPDRLVRGTVSSENWSARRRGRTVTIKGPRVRHPCEARPIWERLRSPDPSAALVLRFRFEPAGSSGTADFMTWIYQRFEDEPATVARIVIHFDDGIWAEVKSSRQSG